MPMTGKMSWAFLVQQVKKCYNISHNLRKIHRAGTYDKSDNHAP